MKSIDVVTPSMEMQGELVVVVGRTFVVVMGSCVVAVLVM